jgi:hypothetical protein
MDEKDPLDKILHFLASLKGGLAFDKVVNLSNKFFQFNLRLHMAPIMILPCAIDFNIDCEPTSRWSFLDILWYGNAWLFL